MPGVREKIPPPDNGLLIAVDLGLLFDDLARLVRTKPDSPVVRKAAKELRALVVLVRNELTEAGVPQCWEQ